MSSKSAAQLAVAFATVIFIGFAFGIIPLHFGFVQTNDLVQACVYECADAHCISCTPHTYNCGECYLTSYTSGAVTMSLDCENSLQIFYTDNWCSTQLSVYPYGSCLSSGLTTSFATTC